MKKQIKTINGGSALTVQYVSCEQAVGDTETEIYETNKLSILLSDGLVTVLDDVLLGGQKGDVLLFNPQEVHFGRFLRPSEYRFLEIYFPLDFFENFNAKTTAVSALFEKKENRVNCIRPQSPKSLEIIALAEEIAKKLTSEDSEFEVFALILRLVSIVAEIYPNAENGYFLPHSAPQVIKAVEYISQNFTQKISLADIAKNSGCSVAYLSRQFKLCTGVTVYNFLIFKRLSYSALLLKTGYTVIEAGLQSGFDDCSNYISAFKKEFKTTPYKYKNLR